MFVAQFLLPVLGNSQNFPRKCRQLIHRLGSFELGKHGHAPEASADIRERPEKRQAIRLTRGFVNIIVRAGLV